MFLYYTSIIGIILSLMLIMIIIVYKDNNLPIKTKKLFICLFMCIFVISLSEWIGAYFQNENINMRGLRITIKVLERSITPVISVICAIIMGYSKKIKRMFFLLGTHFVVECISGYWGLIFYITENNIYKRGNFYWIYVLTYSIAIIYLIRAILEVVKDKQSNKKYISSIVILFLVSGIFIQLIYSYIRISCLCLAISTMLFEIYYSQIVFENDSLTNLLERRSYENFIYKIQKNIAIIYFDVDNFKRVNDEHGHTSGDRCLIAISQQLKKIYAKYGYCYRIGGDEFCVVLSENLDCIEELNKEFLNSIEKIKLKIPYFPNVSVGYALFDYKKDKIEDIIHKADSKMYYNKSENKKIRIY